MESLNYSLSKSLVRADDLLFPIENFPELDLKGPQILETIMDQENAILTLEVQEKVESKEWRSNFIMMILVGVGILTKSMTKIWKSLQWEMKNGK